MCVCVCVKNGKKLHCLLRKTRRKTQIELHETIEHHQWHGRMDLNRGIQIGKPQWAYMVCIGMMKSCTRMNDTSNTDIYYIQCISY